MSISKFILAGILTFLSSLNSFPAASASHAQPRLMFFEYGKGPNRLLELDADGKVVWEHKPPSLAVIFQALPNGNVL